MPTDSVLLLHKQKNNVTSSDISAFLSWLLATTIK